MNSNYKHIFQQGAIGTMPLKNRIVFTPCETLYATVDGQVTQRIIDFYVRRAKGGAGLLVSHSAQGCTKLDPFDPFAHSLRVDDNAYIPMLSELTEAVHREGAKISLLVSAGGGAQSRGFPYDRGFEGVKEMVNIGASEKESPIAQRPVRKLSIDEIKKFVEVYGLSAGRVKMAGFDAISIHAVSYLIGQFISPLYNTRDDEYGGDMEGRSRFLVEIVDACRKNVDPGFPIIVRMSVDEFFPGARGVEETIYLTKRLEEVGVNAVDFVGGTYESLHMIIPPVYLPKGLLVDLAADVKKEVNIPVIVQGRMYDPQLVDDVISSGKSDFVGITRGLLADPCWVNKLEQDREDEIRKCISCNHCIGRVFSNYPVRCALNPTAGREGEFAEIPEKSNTIKKVVIVGAGPGGMETARIAALRGHDVTLFEKTAELGGGQLKLATNAPFKEEYLNINNFYDKQLQKMENVNIVLNMQATIDDIKSEAPDVVVLATGGNALVPEIDGKDRDNVFTNHDQMIWRKKISGKVVIVGGGSAGVETADMLSEDGVDVTVVEMLEECALDEELITRLTLLTRLAGKENVKMLTNHKVVRISDQGVYAVYESNNEVIIPADYVVLALGSVSYNPLEEDVKNNFNTYYVIGDAKQPRKLSDAIAEGFFVGQKI
jgi:2,4-dienoyl-CoA reductase-like NADH-dependent reductase (Old Yellow Enzyme family)/NADPH-dependent 2,4-dienoyl-CoA reductase/sulfur reductase-like enzyme